ncbi:hypothetical protein HHI36_002478 [Cryptolaemus montrouzieri]|uniref:Protein AATF n=1 Tax=Cryptolaemus montrouzieri TaxID=559131 RepID=A0ABD2PB88_9CUCU
MAKKVKNKESISENIANLLNSAPAGFDVDEEEIDQTTAKILTNDSSDEDVDEAPIERSKIRAQNVDLLESLDKKYAGKVGSRKRLRESSEESENDEDFDQDIENGEEEHSSESNETDNEEHGESGDEYNSNSENDEGESNFKHFKDTNIDEQISKGVCVKNQLNLWESLLETRIQLQKCVAASNKMPIGDNFNELCQNSGDEFKNKLLETKKSVSNVLDKMMSLQMLLVKKYPETKRVMLENQKDKENIDASDEEITSEDDVSESEDEKEPVLKRLKKNHEYENTIAKQHEMYRNFRDPTIQKWNDKSRIGTASKNNNSHTILKQIEHILCDKSKLIKKTQLKKSNYRILGDSEDDDDNEMYNENIYDDDDFYHQLLHELIEFKSSDVTDPVQLGRQWIQLQSMRSKMKRKIDTKATKGRKIRYAVHSKLVNFMAPIEYRNSWTYEAKKELFGSLFGKKQIS